MSGIPKKDRFLTRAQVEQRTGLKRSALYRKIRAGEFPAPFRVGRRAVRWSEREVDLDRRGAGGS